MANPQKENGYIAFANDLWDALIRIRIPGEARQCFDYIARKTYGWNKKEDEISISQFVESTGLIKSHVCRVIKKLKKMNMITVTQKGNGITIYAIQKDFDKWNPLPKKVTLPKKVIAVTQKGNVGILKKTLNTNDITIIEGKKIKKSVLPKKVHTKDTRIKPPSTKDTSKKWSPKIKFLVEEYFKTLTEGQQIRFEKQRDKFYDCCGKLMKIDGFSEEEIRKAVNFARNDDFWSQNFLSFLKLRQKDKAGVLYMEIFLNRAIKNKKNDIDLQEDLSTMDPMEKRKNWLKKIDNHLGKKLSVFKKEDLGKIKKKLDGPTFDRILSILKDKDQEN